MYWIQETQNSSRCMASFPAFFAETKKEKIFALRINSFYGDIISAAMKISEGNGQKYFIDINASAENSKINVIYTLRIKRDGRTIKNITYNELWENGFIIKKSKICKQYTN